MTNYVLSDATRKKYEGVSCATLCTALFKRGLRNQFMQDVHPVLPKAKNMVGQAFTLRYIPAREDLNQLTVFQNPAHPQRAAVEQCPPGFVMVMDSRKDPRAASAGSILVSRLMVRGVAGVVTDGGFRDSPEIGDLDIPGPITTVLPRRRTSRCTRRWTSTCRSAAAMSRSGRETSWSATARASSSFLPISPRKSPTRQSR